MPPSYAVRRSRAAVLAVLTGGLQDVAAAAARMQGLVVRTPLLESTVLNNMTGARVLVKAEALQACVVTPADAQLILSSCAERRELQDPRRPQPAPQVTSVNVLIGADQIYLL